MKLTLEVEVTDKSLVVKRFAHDNGDYLGLVGIHTPHKDQRSIGLYLGGGEFLRLEASK